MQVAAYLVIGKDYVGGHHHILGYSVAVWLLMQVIFCNVIIRAHFRIAGIYSLYALWTQDANLSHTFAKSKEVKMLNFARYDSKIWV